MCGTMGADGVCSSNAWSKRKGNRVVNHQEDYNYIFPVNSSLSHGLIHLSSPTLTDTHLGIKADALRSKGTQLEQSANSRREQKVKDKA